MRNQLESERLRGAEVKQLLENKHLKEAFEAAEQSILSQMDEVSLRDTEMHTRLILAKKTINSVKRYLQQVIETGEMADIQLNEPNKLSSMFRRGR